MKDGRRAIRALIVDDEYPARAELRYHLSRHDDVEITGEAVTAREALRLIRGLEYDVVFLDIAMPGLSGIDLAKEIREGARPPWIVFVTAYDDFAVKAFEARALDYILKPITAERVAEALARVRERLTVRLPGGPAEDGAVTPLPPGRRDGSPPESGASGPAPRTQWIMGMRDETAIPIPIADVVYITSEDDQVFVYTVDRRYPTRYTLRELELMLPGNVFFRCHRGYIVNLNFVREISPFFNGTYNLSVPWRGGTATIPVARSRVAEMKRVFWPVMPPDASRRA